MQATSRGLKKLWPAILALPLAGCTNAPSPPGTQSLVKQIQTPEEQCESRSRVNMSDSSQGAALFRAALYDDCLIPFKSDAQEIAKLRHLGQIEALKGYISSGAGSSPNNELVKTKILASADLDTLLAFLELLKTSGKFSDDDLRKLDQLFSHLQISEAFHIYERRTNGN